MGKEKKRHKKKSNKHKKHKKSTRQKTSSDTNSEVIEIMDDTSSSEEWVESGVMPLPTTSQPTTQQKEEAKAVSEQDDWLSNPALLSCVSRNELRQGKEKKQDKNEQDKYMLDKLGQTDRELNPYWKDGGCGLPEKMPGTVDSLHLADVKVGDQGTAWLRKALQRAKEQAVETGRPLGEVVAERWGSLEKLESMIEAAEERDRKKYKNYNEKYRDSDKDKDRKYFNDKRDKHHHEKAKYGASVRDSKKHFARPCDSSDESSDHEKKLRYKEKHRINRGKQYSDKECVIKKSERSDKGQERLKMVNNSSESSDSSSENSKTTYNKYKSEKTAKKKFSKPHSNSSSSSEDEKHMRHKKDQHSQYQQENKSKDFSIGFNKLPTRSNEDNRGYRDHRGKDTYNEWTRARDKSRDSNRKFVRPRRDSEEDNYTSKSDDRQSINQKSYSSGGGWRKRVIPQRKEESEKCDDLKTETPEELSNSKVKDSTTKTSDRVEEPVLTDKELNELAAKLVKAELLGNQELAEELKEKLDKARQAKANAPKEDQTSTEVVILTHTDSKGFTRPVSLSGPLEPSGGRRKAKKVDTHAGGKRMRYFADDDKYSLQEMFQREKLSTVEDSNEVFAKLASKGVGRDDSARDMDDVFEETARMEDSEGRKQARERQKAIEQSKRVARTLDNCQWCLESQQMLKHLIVAIGNTSLTDNHCLIVPRGHTPCATQLDEDVWKEMQDIRKAVVQMFLSQGEDVVFFESARRLNQFPHMLLNCVPVPKETGDMAPVYFKKAIQECEQEWSNNKKLVDLRGRDVRRAVPKGLPYFAVDFGLDSGFAHVIEDEQLFPQNFAQEIIGGMLDLDHSVWRKQRRQTFEDQSKKVIQLSKLWNPFDITKKK